MLNIILTILLLLICGQATSSTQGLLTLQNATELAVQNNPNLAQMRARAEAMVAISPQVSSLPDPTISFNARNLPTNSFNLTQEDMTMIGPGISQSIPFPGKLSLRGAAEDFEAEAALQNITEARLWLLSQVKQAWWQLYYLGHALQIVNNNQELIRQLIQVARTKYEVGKGLQQDILLAQLELSNLLDQQLILNNTRHKSVAQLNALLGRIANQTINLPPQVDLQLSTLLPENILFQLADNDRALLASKRELINASQVRLDLAKKDFYPDVTLGAFYGFRHDRPAGDSRADLLTLNMSMQIPIFAARKQAKAVDQRNSELMQQKYALADEWNNVRAQISQYAGDFQLAKEQVMLFNTGIIPQARQTVASMLAGYQVSQVDFLNLIRSQVALFNHELQYWNALVEAKQASAKLQAAVGKDEIYE